MASISDEELNRAMKACADEPVHVPGIVQPYACMIVGCSETYRVTYASQNTATILGRGAETFMSKDLRQVLGREIWHAASGALQVARDSSLSVPIGTFDFGNRALDFGVFSSDGQMGIEIEAPQTDALENVNVLKTFRFLTRQIQECTNEDHLFRSSVEMLRHVTGYDRVMVYSFDPDFNGEVLSEARGPRMESFLGLRFPHWDIPSQARALMKQVPMRFIQDVDQSPVHLMASSAELPPLDMTKAFSRGVSTVHMEYLRNMGVRATMTLTIMLEDRLWGIISFHHRRPRVPTPRIRDLLISFAELFSFKLQTLQQGATLRLVEKVDRLKADILLKIDQNLTMEDAFEPIAGIVTNLMAAQGVALLDGSRSIGRGELPGQAVLAQISKSVADDPLVIDNLSARFPELVTDLNGVAGVLAVKVGVRRVFCLFRTEAAQKVSWAGNPKKTIETVDGRTRLSPRGSFSSYLEEVRGSAAPWSEQDMFVARQIWNIVNIAERRALMNTLNRQQNLMIDELNHRVRNILALVRSVSRQSRRRYGTLDDYATSLETRIEALAVAHDLASGQLVTTISMHSLIAQELEPYRRDDNVALDGPDFSLRAEVAPVFALVIHELVTNASKYGALSSDAGQLTIKTERLENGVALTWREAGGPPVVVPKAHGFGSVLIQQAVPFEMGGTADISFDPGGISVDLFLPDPLFDFLHQSERTPARRDEGDSLSETEPFELSDVDGVMLILEDNFLIAAEMRDQLQDFGARTVEVFSNTADALELIDDTVPVLAFLDVNLGDRRTSEPLARRLLELGVPFAFVTGYGDASPLPEIFDRVPRLTKPVSGSDIEAFIRREL